ncbi:MAG: ATP-binding protein [Nitrospira sp.]|nr:ATP-binding protein [Nitrospira sp.]MBP6604405.1 ATP-binding protein [Nitrospira sp.]HQY57494.1 ATP-binding protein [Nitrospira sp.]HRA95981.1 ATP-binding protein [Nitrospira sp.]
MTPASNAKKLLLVHPSAETSALVMEQATARGISVITAPDSDGALSMMDMAMPDILLVDWFQPAKTRLALLHEARRRCLWMPIIATAHKGDEHAILDAVRAGAGDYLYSPVRVEEFWKALNRAFERIPQTVEDIPGIEQVEYRLVIGTNPADVESCVTWLVERTAMTLPETQRLHLRTTLIELIVNAVEHGSLEIFYQEKHEALSADQFESLIADRRRHPRFATRRVIVKALYDKIHRRIRYVITDQGNGFRWNGFLTRSDEPCDSRDANGRGVFLAKAFFPDLTYNERGTEVSFSVPLA